MNDHEYFTTTTPPPQLSVIADRVQAFLALQETSHRLCLVTSGGTTVPLENQTVRFLDNFSAGTRGAASAEQFIAAGYTVIFFHRQFSLEPYSRHYSHSTNCFLDYLEMRGDLLAVTPHYATTMQGIWDQYQQAKARHKLLILDFVTVHEYLFILREVVKCINAYSAHALFYLAAAVSDFFIPEAKMMEHKIQSGSGALTLKLEQVPKIMKPLVKKWAPLGYIISFKLETDPSLLMSKSRQALLNYGHHLVVGNILNTRKYRVTLTFAPNRCVKGTDQGEIDATLPPPDWPEPEVIKICEEESKVGLEIEELLIPRIVESHLSWIDQMKNTPIEN